MTGPDDIPQLKAMAAKARLLARATTDRMTIDILENYAHECDAQIARLEDASREGQSRPAPRL